VVVLFLVLVIAALVLGIVGVLVHGLFYLLVIGIVVLIADVVFLAVRANRRRPPVR
jgi:hypothetical protein